jgi:hypothetical protein
MTVHILFPPVYRTNIPILLTGRRELPRVVLQNGDVYTFPVSITDRSPAVTPDTEDIMVDNLTYSHM